MKQHDILGVTMSGLEAGFKVFHIAAFDLELCAPDNLASEVLNDPRLKDFDHIPVKEGNKIVGVLERGSVKRAGSVRDNMRRLDGGMLVSAEESLPKFLPTLGQSPYRLVVSGIEIRGIVTLSDVAKLPVRLLAFTLVAHLEAVLTKVIRTECHMDEDWISLLDKGERDEVQKRLKSRRKNNIHLSTIEVTDLRHKIIVVGKLRRLADLAENRKSITTFRNSLAHDGDFVKECSGVRGLLERLTLVQHWIDALNFDGSSQDHTNA
jgi:hypothetical protein